RAAKAAHREEADSDVKQAEELAAELATMRVPAAPKLILDDVTPERLGGVLQEQRGRVAVMSPEGGLFDIMAGRYSQNGPCFDVLLKAHAGDDLRVDRVNRPSEYVEAPALT